MNQYFATDPQNPHRLPVGLDLGDWTIWQDCPIIQPDNRPATADVEFQIRYTVTEEGEVGFALWPTRIGSLAVIFDTPLRGESGYWSAPTKSGTYRVPVL